MIKYEIYTDSFEFRFGKDKSSIPDATADDIWEWYTEESCQCPEMVGSFDRREDAKAAFNKYYANYGETHAENGNVFWLLRGRVAWIEVNNYDNNGEFDCGVDVIGLSAEPHKGEE